jgi:hypothetical protein
MLRMKLLAATAALALLVNVAPAHAAATTGNFGTFLGLFAGNDSAADISTILGGTSVSALGKVEDPPLSGTNGGLTLTNTTNTAGATASSGDWSTTPAIGWLAVKDGSTSCTVASGCAIGSLGNVAGLYTGSGDAFALYAYSNQTSGSWTGNKFFNASGVFQQISHITAYVPLPAALGLMLTALAGLFGFRRLKQHHDKDAVGTAQAA